ncbi:MAG TPA: deoxyribodipyrimidine photolyase, partial [Gammaproteobacteria bacterium]|nr:deoxyribodipyrimidine photolyase [Gammaproteobacteria bacterium]
IFNPILQGQKFDKRGEYVRQWVPELATIPDKWLYTPWEAPVEVLEQSNVVLGSTYPMPVVDHKQARELALSTYQQMKAG